ncbi:MAG: hypothetical protein ACRYFX_19065 [Janthinobacterium lividum]
MPDFLPLHEHAPDLARFDQLHNALVSAVYARDWPAVRALLTAQLTADRGMQRCALVCMKPIKHLPEVAEVLEQLADSLRSTSTHGVI